MFHKISTKKNNGRPRKRTTIIDNGSFIENLIKFLTEDHLFSTYAKIFLKTNISYPLDPRTYVCVLIRGKEIVVLRKIMCNGY